MADRKIRKAVIHAAGFGARFLPAAKSIPKEMLAVVDKPMIQYAVEEAAAAGIRRIGIVTNRRKQVFQDHVMDAIRDLLGREPVCGVLYEGRHFDAGDKFGFLETTLHFGLKRPEIRERLRKTPKAFLGEANGD
jgi:UTP-glucose-1-phosphate uridylyltransferase